MTYGLISIRLVLGWAAMFLAGTTPAVLAVRAFWLVLLILLIWLSPSPAHAAAGVVMGAAAHLLLQGLAREQRA